MLIMQTMYPMDISMSQSWHQHLLLQLLLMVLHQLQNNKSAKKLKFQYGAMKMAPYFI